MILLVSHHSLPIFVCVSLFITLQILRMFMCSYMLLYQDSIWSGKVARTTIVICPVAEVPLMYCLSPLVLVSMLLPGPLLSAGL